MDSCNVHLSTSPSLKLHMTAPMGIVTDIGMFDFRSAMPSPVSDAPSRSPSRSSSRRVSASSEAERTLKETWLTQKHRSDLSVDPPRKRKYERFRVEKFQPFLASVTQRPKVFKLRVQMMRSEDFPADAVDEHVAPRGFARPAPWPTQRPDKAEPPVLCAPQKSDRSVGSTTASSTRTGPPQPSPQAALPHEKQEENAASKRAQRALAAQAAPRLCEPSPCAAGSESPTWSTAVPGDTVDGASASTLGKCVPTSSPGLPSRDAHNLPLRPPARSGWEPMAQRGPWQSSLSNQGWLHQPEEGVYFHVASSTLWREEAPDLDVGDCHGVARDEEVRIQLVRP